MTTVNEAFTDVTRGDRGLAAHLTAALERLRRGSDDPEFVEAVDRVLSGRSELHDVVFSESFSRTLDPLVARFSTQYHALDDSTRAALETEGRRALADLAHSDAPPAVRTTTTDPGCDDVPPSTTILSSEW